MTISASEKTVATTPLESEPTVAIGGLSDPDAELETLDVASRYASQALIGEGGMGEVRLAHDRQVGRDIALKTMLPKAAARADLQARFLREARVQGQLEHPSIVPVYDIARDESGRVFFTMRRIDGVTLEDVIDRLRAGDAVIAQEYTRHKLLGAFVRVCLALDYAHTRGVVHRDMKPANVMLGRFGEVYVLDWGLAKVKNASRSVDTSVPASVGAEVVDPGSSGATVAGSMLGTPGYMAPEQVRGESATIDARTDVYALGAILFEILTLELLQGEGSIAAIMKRVLDGVDARASVRAPHRDVPPELEALVVRATALDRADRFASARELADAVDAFLSGDRDLELRRALAADQVERARQASRAVGTGELDARREALREAGRALALAPEEPEAIELLVGLLANPPERVPEEVALAVQQNAAKPQQELMPRTALRILAVWTVMGPVAAWAGIRDARLFAAAVGAWGLTAVVTFFVARFDRNYTLKTPYLSPLYALTIALTSVFFGPFLVVPAVAVAVISAYILTTRREVRLWVLGWILVGMLAPVALAALGTHPAAVSFAGDAMCVKAAALRFTPLPSYVFLIGLHVLAVGLPMIFVSGYRDVVAAAETRVQLMAWQLRQLVPTDALDKKA